MPRFEPFAGIRYSPDLDLAEVTAPPYDVIDERGREALVARSDRNAVVFDLPLESDGADRYRRAAETFSAWRADGTLRTDPAPTFTVYRMTYLDDAGRPARTLGVLGALELSRPDEGQILPHEHTTPKAKTDRLDLLRATGANLSAVWMLSLAQGLTALIEPATEPDAEWTDEDGTGHAVWVIADPERVAAISAAVASAPVVVADGHHRFETSLIHRDERRAAAEGSDPLPSDLMLSLVVELSDDELTVRPIHRLLGGREHDDLLAALTGSHFTVVGDPVPASEVAAGDVLTATAAAGALALVAPDGSATLLAARPEAFEGVDDLDSARLAHALDAIGGVEIRYQHGVDLVVRALHEGDATAGVLLRPATVAQIETNAHAGRRMPPKTTFFHPKPRTGVVFRAD